MSPEARNADFPCRGFHHAPDGTVVEVVALDLAGFCYKAKQLAPSRRPAPSSRYSPLERDGKRTHTAAIDSQIGNDPPALSELDFFNLEMLVHDDAKRSRRAGCSNPAFPSKLNDLQPPAVP